MGSPFLITEKYQGKPTNIAFEVYPESAPVDWISIIADLYLPFAVSPLHDKDINENGEIKKAHYHCILCWPGPTTPKKVLSIVHDTLGQPYPEDLASVAGYYAYFTHRNNPEKYQYDPDLIQTFNGFDVQKYDKLSETEKDRIAMRIEKFIDLYRITEYRDVCFLLRECNKHQEYNFLRHNSIHFKTYITSLRSSWSGLDAEGIDFHEDNIRKLVSDIIEDGVLDALA